MLKRKASSTLYENSIKSLIVQGLRPFESLDELQFAPETSKAIIYPTNDVSLNKEQFDAIVSILKRGEELTVMQSGWSNDFFAEGNIAHTFCEPFSFEEYSKLEFFSPSIIFSDLFEWIVIIDESLEGGTALIVGKADRISQFLAENEGGIQDILRFVDFYLNDSFDRGYEPTYFRRMIGLLSGKGTPEKSD